jgi:hypothetical protein
MSHDDLCWLAGLLEGEGSFFKGPPSEPNVPRIQLAMTDEDVVARVARLFGGNGHYSEKYDSRRQRRGWRRVYQTRLKGSRAVDLMLELKPLMSTRRREQIDKAVKSYTRYRYGTLPPSIVQTVKQRVSEGCNKSQLARELGISRSSVYRALGA